MQTLNDAGNKTCIVKTYIIRTSTEEFYCGVTNNLPRRIKEHQQEKFGWFSVNDRRKEIKDVCIIFGNYEKQIKRSGVKLVYNIIKAVAAS